MAEKLDIKMIKQVLEGVDMYEPNMSEKDMFDYYNAIKNSESTASEEDQTRRLNQSQEELLEVWCEDTENIPTKNVEKPFVPRMRHADKKLLAIQETEHNNNKVADSLEEHGNKDSLRDATKTIFGFNDMPPDLKSDLTIVTHDLKFVPIQSTREFLKAKTREKAKMLYSYHTRISKLKTSLARKSFFPALLPKPTSITDLFPNLSNELGFEETYISRSGRQTKRKVYSYDDEDSQESGSQKRTKNSDEEEWLSKAHTSRTSPKIHSKKTENEVSVEILDNDAEKTVPNKESAKPTYTKTPLRKMNNLEIMKRSSLFVDPPKRKPRCEMMFEKFLEDAEKRRRDEEAQEAFTKTLENLDEENDENNHNEEIITVDDEPVRRRVIPPVPSRKPINNRKRSKDEVITLPEPLPITTRKKLSLRKPLANSSTEQPSTSWNTKNVSLSEVPCPICDKSFSEESIAAHASGCGEELVPETVAKISRITCEVCDTVIPMSTAYEAHVKECLAKKSEP